MATIDPNIITIGDFPCPCGCGAWYGQCYGGRSVSTRDPPQPYQFPFVPWSKEAELVEAWTRKKGLASWRIKPKRRGR